MAVLSYSGIIRMRVMGSPPSETTRWEHGTRYTRVAPSPRPHEPVPQYSSRCQDNAVCLALPITPRNVIIYLTGTLDNTKTIKNSEYTKFDEVTEIAFRGEKKDSRRKLALGTYEGFPIRSSRKYTHYQLLLLTTSMPRRRRQDSSHEADTTTRQHRWRGQLCCGKDLAPAS